MKQFNFVVVAAMCLSTAVHAEDAAKCAAGSADILKVDYWAPFLTDVMVEYVNATGQDIEMVHAKAMITDALGTLVAEVDVPPDKSLGANVKASVFISVDQKRQITDANIGDFSAVVCTTSVLYKGGVTRSF